VTELTRTPKKEDFPEIMPKPFLSLIGQKKSLRAELLITVAVINIH
jgi:hypothetical protein